VVSFLYQSVNSSKNWYIYMLVFTNNFNFFLKYNKKQNLIYNENLLIQ
jgi:hypothetical protein